MNIRLLLSIIAAAFVGMQSMVYAPGIAIMNCEAQEVGVPANTSPSGIAVQEPFNMTASLVRMLGGFLFCIGVFGAGIHVYRKYVVPSATSTKRRVKIIERLPLTQKTSLLLVSLDGRELLISSGPDQTRLIQGPAIPTREMFEESIADLYSMPIEEKRCVG